MNHDAYQVLKNKRRIIGAGIIVLVVAAGIWVAADLARISAIKVKPSHPPARIAGDIGGLLLRLERGEAYDAARDFSCIDGACRFLDGRWDTADFRLPTLIRILWIHGHRLDDAGRSRIRVALLGFKYWMDQPGLDSLCYWSENHQILLATGEYLAGKLFPDEIFTNDGKTGREHMVIARERLMAWLGQRWNYGFVEWYSNTYYVEDAAPLATLVDFAGEDRGGIVGDAELAVKATIVLDLLLYDLASQSWRGAFVSTMGRGYERGKKGGGGDSMRHITAHAFGGKPGERVVPDLVKLGHGMDLNLILSRRYVAPEVLRAVADDLRPAVIKASTGLALTELRREELLGLETPQMMMLWAMESFTPPEAISTSVRYAHKHGLFANEFLHALSKVDIGLLRETGLLGPVSRLLRPVTDGVAIQRANTYTWRTPYFQLASAQRYEAGGFGDQQHVWSATLSTNLSVFTTHPAKPLAASGTLSLSPGYWVGNGRNPDVVQDRNVLLALYVVKGRKCYMEKSPVQFTHAWFPEASFDQSNVEGNRAFSRSGQAYIALLAASPLTWAEGGREELLQQGARTAWVCEMGSPDTDVSFEAFKARVSGNPLNFDAAKASLTYRSAGRNYNFTWRGAWTVNGEAVSTDFPRFDSPWVKADRKPRTITITAGGRNLELNFTRGTRVEAPAKGL